MAKRKLGRALSTLLETPVERAPDEPTVEEQSGERAEVEIAIDRIRPNRYQPRTEVSSEKLEGLVESVKRDGVLQPVMLRALPGGEYEIVAGERRWRAAQKAGLKTIPAVLREVEEHRLLELALVENVQREDLNPIEQAKAYKKLMLDLNLTQDEAAKRLGQQRSTLANALRLLELPEDLQGLVSRGTITAGHARAILSIPDPEAQLALVKRIISEGLSVRATESAAAALLGRKAPTEAGKRTKAPHIRELEDQLKLVLGTEVAVRERRRGGRIVIDFRSHAEFERLLGVLGVKLSDGL
jgi:ParB family transcriptional regulator, chromosome partitioning protein